jgi:uncharacterized protein YndB with AHSA1/START domain
MATMTEHAVLNEGMSEGLRMQVSKVIRASREQVFEAWTKPDVIRQWFGGCNKEVANATNDLRVGGTYRIEMQACEERAENKDVKVSIATGVYREIVPNEKLSFTWNGNWNPGEETLVTVTLKDAEGGAFGTEVTITHERFLTTASMGGHEQGWVASLNRLAGFLEG